MSAQPRASRSAASSSRRRASPTASQQLMSTMRTARSPSPESSDFFTPDTSIVSHANVTTRKGSRVKGKGKAKAPSNPREADTAFVVDGITGKRYPKSQTPCVEDSQPPYVRTPSYRYTGYVPDSHGEDTDLELEDEGQRTPTGRKGTVRPYKRVQTTTTTKVVEETIGQGPRAKVRHLQEPFLY